MGQLALNKNSKYVQKSLDVSQLKHPEKYSGKIKTINFRSSWEINFSRYLDENSSVIEWSSEEVIIEYVNKLDNRVHRYFTDFKFSAKDRKGKINTFIVEIKPWAQTQKPILKDSQRKKTKEYLIEQYVMNQSKWEAARKWCAKRKYKFVIITEKDLFIKQK